MVALSFLLIWGICADVVDVQHHPGIWHLAEGLGL